MSYGAEVGSGHIAIMPRFTGFRSAVGKETDAAAKSSTQGFARIFGRAGAGIGRTAGQGVSRGFEGATKNLATATLAKVKSDVASASRALQQARLKEQDSAGRARIAETQLAEALTKYSAGSSQAVRAQERLASAQRAVASAQDVTRGSSERLRSAQAQLQTATKEAAAAATSAGSGFSSAMSSSTSIFSSGGRSSGLGFAGGLSGVLKGGLIAGVVAGFASSVLGGVGNVIGDAVGRIESGLTSAVKTSIDFNSQIESANIGFTTMLGSGQKAATFLNGLKRFAVSTPFEFTDLIKNSQYLLGMGVNAKRVIPDLRALGDSVAATGGNADVLNNTIAAFGQLTAKSTLDMGNLNQLLEGGVPSALKILAAGFHTTTGGMVDLISQGKVLSSEALPILIKGIEKGTSKTAALGGMMSKQSQTFAGAMSNINDSVQQGLGTALQPLFKVFEGIATKVAAFAGSTGFQTFIKGVATAVGSLVNGGLVSQVQGFFQQLLGDPAVVKAGRDLISSIGPAFDKISTAVTTAMPFVLQFAQQVLPPLINGITSTVKHTSEFVGFLGKISPALAPIGGAIAGTITFLDGFRGSIVDAAGAVGRFVGGVVSGFHRFETAILGAAVGAAVGVAGFARDAGAAFGRFATAAGSKVGEAVRFVASLPGRAASALGNLGSRLFSSGAALIGGFVDGIRSKIKAITDAVGAVMAAAKGFFPNSPAKVGPFSGKGWTFHSGVATGNDWAAGIDSTRSTIQRSASAAMQTAALVTASSVSLSGASGAGGTGGGYGDVRVEIVNKTGINLTDLIDVRVTRGIEKRDQVLNTSARMGKRRHLV
jgi:tape measure domain-containing protein